jgi:hypothetical protein
VDVRGALQAGDAGGAVLNLKRAARQVVGGGGGRERGEHARRKNGATAVLHSSEAAGYHAAA